MNLKVPTNPVPDLCNRLREERRWQVAYLRSRIKTANRLQAVVATHLGYRYREGDTAAERKKWFERAAKAVKDPGNNGLTGEVVRLIEASSLGIKAFQDGIDAIEKRMVSLAGQLPVACWLERPGQRGVSLLFLAEIVGEAGDLSGYIVRGSKRGKVSGLYKLYRRLSCAPWTYDDKTHMGAAWRSGKFGTLPSGEDGWSGYGYSPTRRSLTYLIGKNLMMQNFLTKKDGKKAPGPYRRRYEEAKAAMVVKQPDYPPQGCDRHGMLLATKLFLKNLWRQWNGLD